MLRKCGLPTADAVHAVLKAYVHPNWGWAVVWDLEDIPNPYDWDQTIDVNAQFARLLRVSLEQTNGRHGKALKLVGKAMADWNSTSIAKALAGSPLSWADRGLVVQSIGDDVDTNSIITVMRSLFGSDSNLVDRRLVNSEDCLAFFRGIRSAGCQVVVRVLQDASWPTSERFQVTDFFGKGNQAAEADWFHMSFIHYCLFGSVSAPRLVAFLEGLLPNRKRACIDALINNIRGAVGQNYHPPRYSLVPCIASAAGDPLATVGRICSVWARADIKDRKQKINCISDAFFRPQDQSIPKQYAFDVSPYAAGRWSATAFLYAIRERHGEPTVYNDATELARDILECLAERKPDWLKSFGMYKNEPTTRGGNFGTGNPPFQAYTEQDPTVPVPTESVFQSIAFMQNYRNWSVEELRLQDYTLGKKTSSVASTTFPAPTASAFGSTTSAFRQASAFGQHDEKTMQEFVKGILASRYRDAQGNDVGAAQASSSAPRQLPIGVMGNITLTELVGLLLGVLLDVAKVNSGYSNIVPIISGLRKYWESVFRVRHDTLSFLKGYLKGCKLKVNGAAAESATLQEVGRAFFDPRMLDWKHINKSLDSWDREVLFGKGSMWFKMPEPFRR